MNKYLLLYIIICTSTTLHAQVNFKIRLIDGLQDQPVKNYSINLKELSSGTVVSSTTNNEGTAIFENLTV